MSKNSYQSIWDAISDTEEEAANMKMRSDLMVLLHAQVECLGTTQAAAAEKLGITQPRLNDLLQGKISKFSIDALVNLLARAGVSVHVECDEREVRAA
jgi:predicted XRE-type DNA-binding protein